MQRGEGHDREWHPHQPAAEPLDEPHPLQRPDAGLEGHAHQHHTAHSHQCHPDKKPRPGIEAAHAACQEETEHQPYAAHGEQPADEAVGIAVQVLEKRGEKHDRREIQHAVDEDDQQCDREVPVQEQGRRDERVFGGKTVGEEDIEAHRRCTGQKDDLGGAEPVEAFAPIHQKLQAGDRDGKRQKPRPVQARIGLPVPIPDEGEHHHEGGERERDDQEEHPAPTVFLGEIPAEHRTDRGSQHHGHTEKALGHRAIFLGVSCNDQRLGERYQGCAESPLPDPVDQKRSERRRGGAQEG